jgi:hypothetical protein
VSHLMSGQQPRERRRNVLIKQDSAHAAARSR